MSDLSLLSLSEREILTMLAEGHTAKSVAAIKGLSVAAVNERLRSARRKTGVGSSRELARAFRLQENRDEETEVPSDASDPSSLPLPANNHVGRRLLMPILTIAALIAGAMTMNQNTFSAPAVAVEKSQDPLLGGLDNPETNISAMYDRVRSERRDEPWSSHSEAALRERYVRIKRLSTTVNTMRVICGKTLCEVAVVMPQNVSIKDSNELMKSLQSKPVIDGFTALGLKNLSNGFSDSFVTYWTRSASPR